MKGVKKAKKRFIEECRKKIMGEKESISRLAKNTGLGESTIKDFFNNKSDAKLSTVIKILNAVNVELKIK